MSQKVNTNQLNEWISENENFKLIEVLDPQKFEQFHLPGAINVPVNQNFEKTIQQIVPSKKAKIVIYGQDTTSTEPSQAASKLTKLGYTNVIVYQEGKKLWQKSGLPTQSSVGAAAA